MLPPLILTLLARDYNSLGKCVSLLTVGLDLGRNVWANEKVSSSASAVLLRLTLNSNKESMFFLLLKVFLELFDINAHLFPFTPTRN